ncbi:MAG: M20/M25/M40 family metallo-hydrolase [Armatimonadetes bacterium]|nr:M20/M25/M40 family metallo-hydrolase [Armatimonadota bacterium]
MTIDTDRVRQTLVQLFETPSYARAEAGVAAVVSARLAELGLAVESDDCHLRIGGDCGNLLSRVPGTADGPTLLFNSHLDTVEPTDGLRLTIEEDAIRTDGTTVLGGDDKAGVAAILCGVEAVLRAGLPHPPLELLFTVQEEIGLFGAKAVDPAWLAAKVGFVLDHGVPVGQMVVSAPSQTTHEIVFRGRAAHAGVEPEKGINAIACAADAIGRLHQGRIDHETTCNVGVISGGRATNIVPEECRLKAEVRSRDQAKLEAQVAHLRECCEAAAEAFGCELRFGREEAYRAFRIDPDEPVGRLAAAGVRAAGLEPAWADGGGGSDANVFCAAGPRCVVMACGEREVHTHREYVLVSDVVAAARVVAGIITAAAM